MSMATPASALVSSLFVIFSVIAMVMSISASGITNAINTAFMPTDCVAITVTSLPTCLALPSVQCTSIIFSLLSAELQ